MHKEHRLRLKKRFLTEGLDRFEPHNMLELLLFYAIPQKDTNGTAHLLMERFGSLRGVFDASVEDLCTVCGISEHSATLIKLIPALAKQYMLDRESPYEAFDTVDKIGAYLVNKYIGVTVETVYLMLLDNKYKLIDCVLIDQGSVNLSTISPRKLVETALFRQASMAVLAHNHPNGIAVPSRTDIDTTAQVMSAFKLVEVELLEHILVANTQYMPIIKESLSLFRTSEDAY